jgi:hypothetical protein
MKSTTAHSKSAPRQVALFAALGQVVLLIAPHTAVAQKPKASPQQIQVSVPKPLTVQLQPPIPITLARPERDFWDYLSQVAVPLSPWAALFVAIYTVKSSVRTWKLTYLTKDWSALIQFIQSQPKFMDRKLTVAYQQSFQGDDAIRYEMIARLCIGYLDDVYVLERRIPSWLCGSVDLFAATHRKWMEDHKSSYDLKFYESIMCELDKRKVGP